FSASDSPTVYVAADGVLRHLPFELLLPSDDSNGSLIERTEVSYVPSGSMLSWLRKRAAQRHTVDDGPQDVRVFVNSGIDNQHSDTTSPIGLLVSRYNLRPLEATKLEIDALARHLPGRREIFADEEATESALKASPRPVSVLHLAAHAVVDGRPGRGAAILLRPDAMEDGLLQPREIATLEHQIDLTVLAACSTAVELQDSGALSTLAGSFLAAGSSAVMATLWDVGDRATAAFMEQFYYHLGRGLTPSDALRRAKQRLRDDPEWSHPSLWAAYVLIGEAPPLFRPRPSALPWITAGGVVAALLLLVWRRRSMS
ncbi:MAG: CHAT domain-containing protein, partial [Acidobacteriota bacterium]|nr:CHAT domain-containing protein [Acidobacteriota bacterium]